jgi:hypothetical protein
VDGVPNPDATLLGLVISEVVEENAGLTPVLLKVLEQAVDARLAGRPYSASWRCELGMATCATLASRALAVSGGAAAA